MTNVNANTNDYLVRGSDYLKTQPNFELIGRDEELHEVTRALMRKKANSVLLVGNGGIS